MDTMTEAAARQQAEAFRKIDDRKRERLEQIATAVLPALILKRTDTTAQELAADATDYARALVSAIDGQKP